IQGLEIALMHHASPPILTLSLTHTHTRTHISQTHAHTHTHTSLTHTHTHTHTHLSHTHLPVLLRCCPSSTPRAGHTRPQAARHPAGGGSLVPPPLPPLR